MPMQSRGKNGKNCAMPKRRRKISMIKRAKTEDAEILAALTLKVQSPLVYT